MANCLFRPLSLPFTGTARQIISKRTFTTSRPRLASTGAPLPETTGHNLTWPEYLAIRNGRRKWQTAVTIPCALLGLVGGAAYFGTLETDAAKPIMGIDPFFFYGVCTVGCVGAGFLIGPTIGSAVWRTTHRRSVKLIDARDREFYQRIARNRVDATLQSPTNPVPDYYGEKIGSLHQYRQWLRDQGKYRRKALLPEDTESFQRLAMISQATVVHKYRDDHQTPDVGEIIIVRLPEDLAGPESRCSDSDLPSGANYHRVVVISVGMLYNSLYLNVFPVPSYSAIDPASHLSSAEWLLSQPADFQQAHIPLPYDKVQQPLPTPAAFGPPLEVEGWKDTSPTWVQVVPQTISIGHRTPYKSFDPPIKLDMTEFRRLFAYCKQILPISFTHIVIYRTPPPSDEEDSISRTSDPSPKGYNKALSSSRTAQETGQGNHGDNPPAEAPSAALKTLYSPEAVKQAFFDLFQDRSHVIYLSSDSGSGSSDWEDNMDPITFARFYARTDPLLANIVEKHDREVRAQRDKEVKSWAEGVVSADFAPE